MAITQENIDHLASVGCTLNISGIDAYVGMEIPPAPKIRINIVDGSLFPKDVPQYIESDTFARRDIQESVNKNRRFIYRTYSTSPTWLNFELTTVPSYEFNQTDIDELAAQNVKAYANEELVVLGSQLRAGDVLKLVCDAGYEFDTENTLGQNPQPRYSLTYTDRTGNSTGQMPVTNEGTIATHTITSNVAFFTYNGFTFLTVQSANVDPPVFEWGSDQNFTAFKNKVDVYINDVKTPSSYPDGLTVKLYQDDVIKIVPKTDYILEDNQGNYFIDENGAFDYFNIVGGEGLLTLGSGLYTGVAFSTKNIFNRLTVSSTMLETLQTNNAAMFINDVPVSIGDTAINGDMIKVVASAGYELAERPSIQVYNTSAGYQGVENFSLFGDGGGAELVIDLQFENYLDVLKVTTTQIDVVTGANNLYKISNTDLKQINLDRFVNSGANPPTVIDYGTNILGVINLPFDIGNEFIQDDELIKLGAHETTVTAPKIVTDKLYLDLGDVDVPMPEDSLGFANATAIIHLPYANSLPLEIDVVLGQVINVEYVIDLYNGNSYVNIKSNKSDSIIASNSVDLGIKIPYSSMVGVNNEVYNSNMALGGDNHVRTPYIEIIQNTPILGDGFFTIPITDEGELLGATGFVQVEEVNLNVSASGSEAGLIVEALKTGVIIK